MIINKSEKDPSLRNCIKFLQYSITLVISFMKSEPKSQHNFHTRIYLLNGVY